MMRFKHVGYIVKVHTVDSVEVGLPMTRKRIHYQGLHSSVPNADEEMDCMDRLWCSLIKLRYTPVPLDSIFADAFSARFVANDTRGSERPTVQPAHRKWWEMHSEIMEQHEAVPHLQHPVHNKRRAYKKCRICNFGCQILNDQNYDYHKNHMNKGLENHVVTLN